eukprot:s741_g15.t1
MRNNGSGVSLSKRTVHKRLALHVKVYAEPHIAIGFKLELSSSVLEALRVAIYPARLEVSWALFDARADGEAEAVARGQASLACYSASEAESLVGRLSNSFEADVDAHRLLDTTFPPPFTMRSASDTMQDKDQPRSPSPSPAPGRGRPASAEGFGETRRPWLRCACLPPSARGAEKRGGEVAKTCLRMLCVHHSGRIATTTLSAIIFLIASNIKISTITFLIA